MHCNRVKLRVIGLLVLGLSLAGWGWGFLPDRRFVAPAIKPYTSAVRIQVNGCIGCGYLVGPDLVLTAGHVAFDGEGKVYPGIAIECGVTEGKPSHVAHVRDIKTPPNTDRDVTSGNDWALLRLDQPMGQVYGWLECLELNQEELQSLPIESVGFSGFEDDARKELRDYKTAYVGPGTIRDVGPNIVFHDSPAWSGTSGSALIAWRNLKPYVVGVVSAGVDVQGEILERGFRRTYQKELANIAVPSHRFITSYRELLSGVRVSPFKTVWVRNHQRKKIKVRVRYDSALTHQTHTTDWIEIPSQKRVCVLESSSGCQASEILLSASTIDAKLIGPRPTQEFTVGEEKVLFFRRPLGASDEHTISLP